MSFSKIYVAENMFLSTLSTPSRSSFNISKGHFTLRCDYCISVSNLGETMTRFDERLSFSDWKGTDFSISLFFFDVCDRPLDPPHTTPLVNHPASQIHISCLKYKSTGVRSDFSWPGHI